MGLLPFVLLVNKADVKDQWEVGEIDLERLRNEGCTVLEASARTGSAVDQAFLMLTDRMLEAGTAADDDDAW
jgi:hypothetical protein